MTRLLSAALLIATATPALAQRLSTLGLTCAQARATVAQAGGIVLGTGGQTYDRFVRDASFCEITQTGKRAFVPARDTRACFVGYTCYEPGQTDRFGGY